MIEFDYLLERDEHDEKKVYMADNIKSPLPNIVYIEGPNSSGKSALLHILALSMHGLKNETINQSLLNKMRPLIESEYQRLKFDVCITNNDGTLKLLSTKKDFDKSEIEIREIKNGHKRILGPELFKQEYELIYDIPDNPTERLTQLSKEIVELQRDYGHNVSMLSGHILETIREIRSGFDPEKLHNLEVQLEQLKINIKKEKENYEKHNSSLDILEKYTISKYLLHYSEMVENTQIKLKDFEIKTKGKNRKRSNEDERLKTLERTAQKKVEQLNGDYVNISSLLKIILPKEEYNHLNVWERISIQNSLVDLEFDKNLITETVYFENVLRRMLEKKDEKAFTEAEVYKNLINILENYKNTTVIIPGVDKNISEFLSILKAANKKNEKIINLVENVEKTQKLLDSLREQCNIIESTIFEAIKKLRAQLSIESENSDNTPIISEGFNSTLTKEIKYYEEKEKIYLKQCLKKGINVENIFEVYDNLESEYGILYNCYTEEQLNDKIKELETSISTAEITIDNLEKRELIQCNEIDKLKGKKPHKYQSQLNTLNKLLPISQKLQQKLLVDYGKYISLITENKRSDFEKQKNKNPELITYFESISKYLANRVEAVRYIDKTYDLESVDLLNEVLLTKNGKIIRLSDMGTGQSQSAFLLGLLNKSHKKPIIALFDEVAMMDTASLEPIYHKFNDLYNRGLLLVGVVVQKGDHIKIESKQW